MLKNNSVAASSVKDIFTSVSENYDLMNTLMSAGQHQSWKKRLVSMASSVEEGSRWVDLAAGSGDVSIYALDAFAEKLETLILIDPNKEMLHQAERKLINANYINKYTCKLGVAEDLPLKNESVDIVSCSFGLRNTTDRGEAISEISRVLRPNGQLLLMEFSYPEHHLLKQFFQMYGEHVLPKLGQYIANDKEAYEYLYQSIKAFPPEEQIINTCKKAGLLLKDSCSMGLGVVKAHCFTKRIR